MTMINHIAGGAVFTGFFASIFFGVNILASPLTIAATVVASLLPDVDHTRSTIGKMVFPLARWLNRRFGHRTITHGLPCMTAFALLTAFTEKTFFGQTTYTGIITLGYFSHLVFDMCTLQGVPLLYPFSRSPFVLIGNPEARIRTADYRKEAVAFGIFIAAGFSLQPLFEKGFWTTYNQQFATLKHLHSEFTRSEDMLLVKYEIQEGMEIKRGSGFCIESKASEAWLLDSAGQWILLKDPMCRRSFPEHTGRHFHLKPQTFITISADSLNQLLLGKTIQSIEVQGNQPFQVSEENSFPKTASSFAASHLNEPLLFSSLIPDTSSLQTAFIPDRAYEAEIQFLQAEIRRIQRSNSEASTAKRRHDAMLAQLTQDYSATGDVIKRQEIYEAIKALEKEKLLGPEEEKIEELNEKIEKIRRENSLRADTKKREIELQKSQELDRVKETRLTGILTWVEMDGK